MLDVEVAVVTRIQAAHRQVERAIRLHFAESDPVVVHSIAGNAANLLTVLAQHVQARSWEEVRDGLGIPTKVYFNVMRAGIYFLKHVHIGEDGKLDGSAQFEFRANDTEAILCWAVQNLGIVDAISEVERIFQLWFLATRVAVLGRDYQHMEAATAAFPGVGEINGAAQRAAGHAAPQTRPRVRR
jgi:hypothetical protein